MFTGFGGDQQMRPSAGWNQRRGCGAGALLTHGREPLGAGVAGEVGEVFRKEGRGLQGLTVVQVKRVIWGGKGKGNSEQSTQATLPHASRGGVLRRSWEQARAALSHR